MINLLEEFHKLMKEQPLPYGRKPVQAGHHNNGFYQQIYILCSPKSIVYKYLYRDEGTYGCYVLENNVWMDYQLDYILGSRKIKDEDRKTIEKPSRTATLDERWMYSIKNTYNTLLNYGDDVLKGDLEWTKETRYPPHPAHADIYTPFRKDGDETSYTQNVDFVSVPPDPATIKTVELGILTPYGFMIDEMDVEKKK